MTGLIVFLVLLGIFAAIAWQKGWFGGLAEYFNQVKFEMGKVTWPSRDEVINSTVLVFIVTIILTFMVMIVDGAFARLFSMLLLGSK
ncbi:MAG: preprotein translocase subunit SecE [Candidatus Sumerlaeia bacterium]